MNNLVPPSHIPPLVAASGDRADAKQELVEHEIYLS
jgi:hypothetical protein